MQNTVFERYIDQRFNGTEGERGSRNLNDMLEAMGYGQGWMRNRAFEEFVADNPGAIEAILNFIEENIEGCPEWMEGLESELMEEEE